MYEKKETLIHLNNVSLGYDGIPIVKNLTLTEHDIVMPGKITGQSIAFLGRSGRGKSTIFNAFSGLLSPLSGEIWVNLDNGPALVREGDIGFVDQQYTLFRHKTVNQMLTFAMRHLDIEGKQDVIDFALDEWGLHGQGHKYDKELSGGQKQRVAILEKLLAENHYIIMDEPISGLDIVAIEKVKENFQKILTTHEKNTIIFSTHDLNFACEMADVIYVIGHVESKDYSTIKSRYELYNADRKEIQKSVYNDLVMS